MAMDTLKLILISGVWISVVSIPIAFHYLTTGLFILCFAWVMGWAIWELFETSCFKMRFWHGIVLFSLTFEFSMLNIFELDDSRDLLIRGLTLNLVLVHDIVKDRLMGMRINIICIILIFYFASFLAHIHDTFSNSLSPSDLVVALIIGRALYSQSIVPRLKVYRWRFALILVAVISLLFIRIQLEPGIATLTQKALWAYDIIYLTIITDFVLVLKLDREVDLDKPS